MSALQSVSFKSFRQSLSLVQNDKHAKMPLEVRPVNATWCSDLRLSGVQIFKSVPNWWRNNYAKFVGTMCRFFAMYEKPGGALPVSTRINKMYYELSSNVSRGAES